MALAHAQSLLPLHDKILSDLPTPWWLFEGELTDNKWTIRTGDPDVIRQNDCVIDFQQNLTAWPDRRLLTDAEFENDLITAKLLIYYSLSPAPVGWSSSGRSAVRSFHNYLNFARWRVDRGLRSNSSLTAEWFREFDSALKDHGREGLLRLGPRVPQVISGYERGLIPIPMRVDSKTSVASDSVAQQVGVNFLAQLTLPARRQLNDFFRRKNLIFGTVSPEKIDEIADHDTMCETTAYTYYSPWQQLWRLRDLLPHDPIGYRAFKNDFEVRKWAKSWSREIDRTGDCPEYQTAFLVNASLKLATSKVVDDVLELVEAGLREDGTPKDDSAFLSIDRQLQNLGFPSIAPRFDFRRSKSRKQRHDLFYFVFRIIPTICKIIIATFSARRDEEVSALRQDCLEQDALSNHWLKCLIGKNMRKIDRVPIPRSVVRAVQLISRVRSLGNRQSRWLFDFACPRTGKNVSFYVRNIIKKVCKYLSVPPLKDGTFWAFRPHQFRKFFGTTYYFRWAFPNLTALSFQYRHFNPTTTRGYLEMQAAAALHMADEKGAAARRKKDRERKTDFDRAKVAFVRWVVGIAGEGQQLTGAAGRRIQAQVEEIKRTALAGLQPMESIEPDRAFNRLLDQIVDLTSLEPHPEGHSLCACGAARLDLEQSRCLQEKWQITGIKPSANGGADVGFASDDNCAVCPMRVGLPSMMPYWEESIAEIEAAMPFTSDEQASLLENRSEMIRTHVLS